MTGFEIFTSSETLVYGKTQESVLRITTEKEGEVEKITGFSQRLI